MSGHSFTFTHALCRAPSVSISKGLRAADQGDPSPEIFQKEHDAYVAALRATGATVRVLDPKEEFPDSVFIEDAALCLKGKGIVLRPGTATRVGESADLRPTLLETMNEVIDLKTEGYVDGGDILCSDDEVMIGLSARTDQQGAEDLRPIVEALGYSMRILQTPADILHFKTESSLLDAETIFATEKLAKTGCFDAYKVIQTPAGEESAANAIRFNDCVFLSAGHPRSAELLDQAGYKVVELPTTQAALVDGGLSCMSLRFSL